MTVLEDLKLEYLTLKKDMEDYQSDEQCAHNKVIECKKKMERIEKIFNREKLKESIYFIKDFCAEKSCENCPFYTGKQTVYERCSLMNTNPTQWQI